MRTMVSVAACLAGGRDLWERVFPTGTDVPKQEREQVKEKQSGGCQRDSNSSCGCSCSSGMRSGSREPAPPAPISAATKEEAVELSLKAFAGQLGAQFSHADFLTDRILELVGPNVSPAVIGEVIGAYLKRRGWQPAMAVAKKSGRELTGGEIQHGFSVLADYADLEGFAGLAEAVKTEPEAEAYIRLISQVSRLSGSDIDWSKLVQVLETGAPQKAIDLAVILCARFNYLKENEDRVAGFEIIAKHKVSDDARQKFLGAFIATGSIEQSQAAAQKIFGRELSTDEFCQATTAASQIAEKKRRRTQESYESED